MSAESTTRLTAVVRFALLMLWLGAALLLAAVVAPAAFAALPTRTLAGAVVGRVLPPIFYAGIVVGLVAGSLSRGQGRRRLVTVGTVAGFLVAVSSAVAQLAIAPRIERVRASIAGPVDSLAATEPRRIDFGRLHAESVLWLGVGMVAAAVGAVSAAGRLRQPG